MDFHSLARGGVAILVIAVGCAVSSLYAKTYSYTANFNLPIPAEPGSSKGLMDNATIFVSEHLTIEDLDVLININHSCAFDLQIYLQNPAGQSLCLNMYDFELIPPGQDYIQTIFDDEAVIPIEDAEPPFTGRFKPLSGNMLTAFDDQDAYGYWQIKVNDMAYNNTGTFESAALFVSDPLPEPGTIMFLTLGGFFVKLTTFTHRGKAKNPY
jgi:subtilisin-like proprotein convertase family protein